MRCGFILNKPNLGFVYRQQASKKTFGFAGHYGNCFLSQNGATNWFLRVVRHYPNAGV
jgi:hypothetical protein